MIREMVMPQLAMGMSEGTIAEWAVAEGDRVEKDVNLLSIETEKVVTDLPSPYCGYLHICAVAGTTVPVEQLIAQIAETEEEYRQLLASAKAPAVTGCPMAEMAPAVTVPATVAVAAVSAPGRRQPVSGLAKKIAAQNGLDLASLAGSGPGGRIVKRDVVAALASTASVAAPKTSVKAAGMREKARVPLAGMRKAIAERMLKSKTTTAHTYVFFEIDVTKLVAARKTILAREEELGTRVSMTAFYARAMALACRQVPIINSTLVNDEIIIWENVNIGIATALPGKSEYESGLVVPVLRDVESKGVLEIDREIRRLVTAARDGSLTARDTADGTVTMSSTAGFMGGEWCVSTPLLNQPQVFNFQPGTPIEKPVVVDGAIVIRTMLPCGLSFDHRAMDGVPVARFNRKIADLLSHPELMVL